MTFSVYLTGTDIGIGKTLVARALLHALRGRGLRAVGMKPVASGCVRVDGRWRSEDALALHAAGEDGIPYADINPFALQRPFAPELAARDAGVEVTVAPLQAAHARLAGHADAVIVEGVGGWATPLSATLMQADVVAALRLPVLLVVGLRPGCLNHALLGARAIVGDGAHLAGWIGSHVDPGMERVDDTVAILRQRLPAPCWGTLPHAADPDAESLARHLRVPMLAG